VLTCPGNHEEGSSEAYVSYNSRWRMCAKQSGSSDNTYWSRELGSVHVIALNSYAPTEPGSQQHTWLVEALARVDRARTPWLAVMMHAPFYCSNSGHVEETRLMRRDMERVLYEAGVDLVLNGHVHAYERTFGTFDMKPDECGPVYLNLGDGGNREGAYVPWLVPQPEWSAYRESSFGVGLLQLLNATHARYEWRRHSCQGSSDPSNVNFEQPCESVSRQGTRDNGQLLGVDEVVLVKPTPAQCANRWRSGARPAAAVAFPAEESGSTAAQLRGAFADEMRAMSARLRVGAAAEGALAVFVGVSLVVNCGLAFILLRHRRLRAFSAAGRLPGYGASKEGPPHVQLHESDSGLERAQGGGNF